MLGSLFGRLFVALCLTLALTSWQPSPVSADDCELIYSGSESGGCDNENQRSASHAPLPPCVAQGQGHQDGHTGLSYTCEFIDGVLRWIKIGGNRPPCIPETIGVIWFPPEGGESEHPWVCVDRPGLSPDWQAYP